MLSRHSARAIATITAALAACSANEPSEILPATITALQGSGQSGTPGVQLPDSLIVMVKDRNGMPMADVLVNWSGSNGGVISPLTKTTDANGQITAAWRLGLPAGPQTAWANVTGLAAAPFSADARGLMADTVTGGAGYGCALTGTTAYCWGFNTWGNLGDGDKIQTASPVRVSGGIAWSSVVASGGGNTCGIAVGGVVYCWGNNDQGGTGTGLAPSMILTPIAIASNLTFTAVSGGDLFSGPYACGLTSTMQAACWGDDGGVGRLGLGSVGNQRIPTTVSDTFRFTSIHTGIDRTCALTPRGAAYCWGSAALGNMGPRPPGIYASPVAVAAGFTFKQLAVLALSACGLELDGTVDCWGANFFGALGTGLRIDSTVTPLPVSGGLKFKQVVGRGEEAVFALTLDGRLFYWGSPGNDIPQDVPVPFAPTLRFKSIADADDGFCGIEESGLVYCGAPLAHTVQGVPVP